MTKLDSWGYQWLTFDEFAPDADVELGEILSPLDEGQFQDQVVLDAGCGNGRFTRACARLGARWVIGIDPSQSVRAARANTADLPNAAVMRGDIFKLPFSPASFDQVFCIGVIHHLPDPRAGFMALTRALKPGAKISIWVYAVEGNELVMRYFEPFRKAVSSKLPWGVTKALAAAAATVLWLLVAALYAPARALWPALWERLPMHDYLWYIYRLGWNTIYTTTFDKLSPEVCTFLSRADLEEWFSAAGLSDVVISPRNGNSWRAQGRRPAREG